MRFAFMNRQGVDKVVLMLSYTVDEVGNHLVDEELLDEKGVNPWSDVLSEKDFREVFGHSRHPFTGVDYIDYYKSIVMEYGTKCEVIFSNNPATILDYTKTVLACDIHTRKRTEEYSSPPEVNASTLRFPAGRLMAADTTSIMGFWDPTRQPKASSHFPRNCQALVEQIQRSLREKTGKTVEAVYGDGAFRDPVGKIWELADPVVSPGYTKGLEGTPNEVKLKYLADNNFAGLKGEEQKKAIEEYIRNKNADLVGAMESQGTTPRRLTDLIGSLCDLTSGSGDKGTPVVYIQGYFDNFTK